MKDAKIKMLQAYQAIRFAGSLNTYFVDDRYRTESHGSKVARVRMEATENGVLVYNDDCAVLVGWANVGSLEYDRSSIGKSTSKSKTATAKAM
jgi:hypothetical protein